MKNVIVTGAGGFIGSHLVESCVELGYKVKAFVHYNSRNDWGWLENYSYIKDIELISGDIRDFDSVHGAIKGCDTIFHLAALIGIPYSYVSPLAYLKTNIEGTYNILQSSRMLKVENILVTSTSETYGTAEYAPIDEKHPLKAQSPYSATKIAADALALSFYRSYNLPVKIVRPFNTYGPRQSARAIIPTIITQILKGKDKIELGNLSPKRDLTYVKDTVLGFMEIARSGKTVGEVINIGTNKEISIEDIASLIAKLIGVKIEIVSSAERIRPEKSEIDRLLCDNSKLTSITNWKQGYDIEKGLKETINWFRDNLERYKFNIYNV